MSKIAGFEFPDDAIISDRPAGLKVSRAAGVVGSELEASFLFSCRAFGLPEPRQQWLFADEAFGRRWRFDYAWPEAMVAVEVDGGIWGTGPECPTCEQRQPGRHLTGTGFLADCEKAMAATRLGWALIKFPQPWVDDGKGNPDSDRFEELAEFIAARLPEGGSERAIRGAVG